MKEYKSKLTTMIFQSLLGLAAMWFVYNLVGRLTHSFLFAVIVMKNGYLKNLEE